MEWTDDGVVLLARPHGEASAVVELLTREHGRHAGLVRGAASRRMRPVLQPGNGVRASWKARLAAHLGYMTVEGEHLRAGRLMDDAAGLEGLSAACALCVLTLPEREPHPAVYEGLEALLAGMEATDRWPALLVKWEAGLLADLGYGLDVERCALTGSPDVTHVSPASGRAVCGDAPEAQPYLDKLLKLPAFLLGAQAVVTDADIADGLALTGHFLERRVLWPASRQLPGMRAQLAARFRPAPGEDALG